MASNARKGQTMKKEVMIQDKGDRLAGSLGHISEKDTPISMVRKIAQKDLGIFEMIEESMREDQNQHDEQNCLSVEPMLKRLDPKTILMKKPDRLISGFNAITTLVCCAEWRKFKKVYVLDDELEKTLIEQADSMDLDEPLSGAVLMDNMPYPVIYVKSNHVMEGRVGFFAAIEVMHGIDVRFLTTIFFDKNMNSGPVVRIPIFPALSLYDGFLRTDHQVMSIMTKLMAPNGRTCTSAVEIKSNEMQRRSPSEVFGIESSKRALQILLYIIAANADKRENPVQAAIYKPSSTKIRDTFREVRQIDVGVQVGRVLRLQNGEHRRRACVAGVGKGVPKRPHLRRAHFHGYWVGTGEDRRLILRWLAPMVIHEEDLSEETVFATPVMGPREKAEITEESEP